MALQRLISVDSHVAISHDAVLARLDRAWHDEYQRAVAANDAAALARQDGQRWGDAVWTDWEPFRDPGYRDPEARLRSMDRDGVDAEVLYSELSAFRVFAGMADGWKQASRAFNDALEEFASVDPKRLLVSYQVPLMDIDHAVSEVLRLAASGARSVHLPNYPSEVGLPEYHDARYDPLWAVLSETGIPVSQHLGIKEGLYEVFRRDPTPQKGIFASLAPMALAETLGFWILGGTLARFPDLKIVLVEPGLAWVPFYVHLLDIGARGAFSYPGLDELPSFYFRRQVYLTFVEDPYGLKLRHDIGVENIMWSTDYPHPLCSWPNSRQMIESQMHDIDPIERDLIVRGNAARVYGL